VTKYIIFPEIVDDNFVYFSNEEGEIISTIVPTYDGKDIVKFSLYNGDPLATETGELDESNLVYSLPVSKMAFDIQWEDMIAYAYKHVLAKMIALDKNWLKALYF